MTTPYYACPQAPPTSQTCPEYRQGWFGHQSLWKRCRTPQTGQTGCSHPRYADQDSTSVLPTQTHKLVKSITKLMADFLVMEKW